MQLPHADTGGRTARLISPHASRLRERGGVLLMRHSAREFEPGRHDLLNPLTDEGRELSSRLGAALPDGLHLRGYASPAERCVETATLMLNAYEVSPGNTAGRTRPMEGLGVFYVLDQMKMFRALQSLGGLREFVSAWVNGELAADIVLPARQAVIGLLSALAARLDHPATAGKTRPSLDVCVSHDLTLQVVRSVLYEISAVDDGEVEFLDGLLLVNSVAGASVVTHDRTEQPLAELLGSAWPH